MPLIIRVWFGCPYCPNLLHWHRLPVIRPWHRYWTVYFGICDTHPDSTGSTWGQTGADRTQVGPMLAPWNLLSGHAPLRQLREAHRHSRGYVITVSSVLLPCSMRIKHQMTQPETRKRHSQSLTGCQVISDISSKNVSQSHPTQWYISFSTAVQRCYSIVNYMI